MIILQNLSLLLVIVALIYLSWTDIKFRIIDNKVILFLLVFIVVFSLLTYGKVFIFSSSITLIIGFLLFLFKIVGGGDVKLVAVLMLALPQEQILSFLFFTSFHGVLSVIVGYLFFRRSIIEKQLPYGVAISLGFLTNLVLYY